MADVDTSSYLKPTIPAQKSLMEQVKSYGDVEQQKNTITKQQLDLVNQRYGYLLRELNSLPANATSEDLMKVGQQAVNMKLITPEMYSTFVTDIPKDPTQVSDYRKQIATKLATTQEAINYHYGQIAQQSDNSKVYTGIQQSPLQGGGFKPVTETPLQLPPTTPQVNNNPNSPNYLQPGYIGPSGPSGPKPLSANTTANPVPPLAAPNQPFHQGEGRIPGEVAPQATPQPAPSLRNNVAGAIGPTRERIDLEGTEPAKNFDDRFGASFPNRVVTGAAPGVAAAIQAVGEQSGKDYASALTRAKNFQADLYPAEAALEGIRKLGTQGVGPGTDALNNIKSAIITWLPNAKKEDIEKVADFEATRKYLTQIARSSGSTGTNDQLAAAFEANPSIKMSQAATETVLKSVIALRKMEHAQTLLFNEQGLPPNEYSKWVAKNQNVFDPRAFGFTDMSKEAKQKLISSLTPKQKEKFEKSLEFAIKAELIAPPKLK